jgi:hypothetical protein
MISFGEMSDRFQASFARFKGELEYCGGRTFKVGRLMITEDGPEVQNALVTFENDRTVVVNVDTDKVQEIMS